MKALLFLVLIAGIYCACTGEGEVEINEACCVTKDSKTTCTGCGKLLEHCSKCTAVSGALADCTECNNGYTYNAESKKCVQNSSASYLFAGIGLLLALITFV